MPFGLLQGGGEGNCSVCSAQGARGESAAEPGVARVAEGLWESRGAAGSGQGCGGDPPAPQLPCLLSGCSTSLLVLLDGEMVTC